MGVFQSSEPTPPTIPIQHTYYYIIHGRVDHAYRFIRALSYSKATLLQKKTIFGPWLIGGYGRQMLKQCPVNTLLDHVPYHQLTETFGLSYAPKRIDIPSSLINSWDLLPPNTAPTDTEVPTTIPFLAIGSTESIYDSNSTCIGKAWAPFEDYAREYYYAERSPDLKFTTMRANPVPVGFVTNANPNTPDLPVKWAGVPFVGLQDSGDKTDEELLGHLYQPPTSAINITGLIHYDGLNDIVDVGHVDKVAATMMGHLIVVNLMAPSARISIKQFITETHQYLSKGCIIPLLEKPVTIIAMTEKIDTAVLDRDRVGIDEILHELTLAGFSQIEVMTLDCNPTYPLLDEFEDNSISKWGMTKRGSDGRFVGKRSEHGTRKRLELRQEAAIRQKVDISTIPNPDGLEDDEVYMNDILKGVQTTTPMWDSSCQADCHVIQQSNSNFFTEPTAERMTQYLWEQVLPVHLSHCRNGLFDRVDITKDVVFGDWENGQRGQNDPEQGQNDPQKGQNTDQNGQKMAKTPQPTSLIPPSQFPLAYYTRTNVATASTHGGFEKCNLVTALEKAWQTPPTASLSPNSPHQSPTPPQLNPQILSQIVNSISKRNIKDLDRDPTLLHQHHRIGQHLLYNYLKWLASPNSLTNSGLPQHYPSNPHGKGIDYNNLGGYLHHSFKFISNPRPTPLFFDNSSNHFPFPRPPNKQHLHSLDYLPPYIAPVSTPDAVLATRVATPPYPQPIFMDDGHNTTTDGTNLDGLIDQNGQNGDGVGDEQNKNNNGNGDDNINTIPWSQLPTTYEFDSFIMYDNRLLISDPSFQLQTAYLPPLPDLNRYNINTLLQNRLGKGIKRRLLESQQYHLEQQRLEFGEHKIKEAMDKVVGSYKATDVMTHIAQTIPRSIPNRITLTKSGPNPYLSQFRAEVSQKNVAPDSCNVVRDREGDNPNPTVGRYYKVWLQSWDKVQNIIKSTSTHYIQSKMLRHMRQAEIIQSVHFRGSFTHRVGEGRGATTSTSQAPKSSSSTNPQPQPLQSTTTSPPISINMTYHYGQTCTFLDPYHPSIGTTSISSTKKCPTNQQQTSIDPNGLTLTFPSPLLSGTAFCPLFYLYGIIILPFIYVGGKGTQKPPIPALGQFPEWLLNQLAPPETPHRNPIHNIPTAPPTKTTIQTPSDFLPTYQQSGLLWPLGPATVREQFDPDSALHYNINYSRARPQTLALPHLDCPIHFVVLLLNDVDWEGSGDGSGGDKVNNPNPLTSSSLFPELDPTIAETVDYLCDDNNRLTRVIADITKLRSFHRWDKEKDDNVIGNITKQQYHYLAQNVPQAYFNQITTQIFNPLITGGVPVEKMQALFKVDFCHVGEFNTLFDHVERDAVDIRVEMYGEKVLMRG